MNNRPSKGLVVTGLSAMLSLAAIQTAHAGNSPNCSDVLAGNKTAASQKMTILLGEDITKSNLITTVVPAKNNPFVTEELVSVSNNVSPNGPLSKQSLEEIKQVRENIEKAGVEVSKLQGTFEVAFVSLIDGHCQFSTNQLTTHAKIDFDHLEGLTAFSIPALLTMVDKSYSMAEKRIAEEEAKLAEEKARQEEVEREKERQQELAAAAAAARYQDPNVLVKVEKFDGSNVTFSVTNLSADGELQPNFNTFRAYQTDKGELIYKSESLLSLVDSEGNGLTTVGIAELGPESGTDLVIAPGETRTFITSIESEVASEMKLSLEFPAKVLNTDEAFSVSFTDAVAMATAGLN
ncbi:MULTISPECIES: hypothetical protein [Vibrio]|uniref:Uncharacterized protein n=1 Tax=Vibrio harveyi TaxID=669 RepID=A0A8B3DIW6_VIBHA|nr:MULTISPECIES: hypothetical protein [Vibrio]EKM17655.1 hypothetical protein VCHENC01_5210 [Vibrio harveyi]EKO3809650.1 hypothetical protein [Vibrio harveyi]EKO3830783.1 hypothetical protein [Vibrio harveyi]EKY4196094.1 hypothetical protein [Vibrio harveyi]ELV8770334.1 hypothetical protein [Vibrio harveyi]